MQGGGDGYLGKRCGLRARGCGMLTGLLPSCEELVLPTLCICVLYVCSRIVRLQERINHCRYDAPDCLPRRPRTASRILRRLFEQRLAPFLCIYSISNINMSVSQINKALPTLPAGWSADKDFKAIGKLSAAARRNVEPVGPYFLAHARRVRMLHLYYTRTPRLT
jgi:hypothetical protein